MFLLFANLERQVPGNTLELKYTKLRICTSV